MAGCLLARVCWWLQSWMFCVGVGTRARLAMRLPDLDCGHGPGLVGIPRGRAEANATFCGWSCPGFARGPAIGAGRSARRRRQAGWVQDVCPSQTD
jgi:hypothetical protein